MILYIQRERERETGRDVLRTRATGAVVVVSAALSGEWHAATSVPWEAWGEVVGARKGLVQQVERLGRNRINNNNNIRYNKIII